MSALVITPKGKHSAESTHPGRSDESRILRLLYGENGPVGFEEVMDETRLTEEECSEACRKLMDREYIREI